MCYGFLKRIVYIWDTVLTNIKAKPIIKRPMSEANQRPIRCPKGPKRLVPIRYDMEAGRKAAPSCHFSASILSIMKMGNDGSSIAIPILAKVMAPSKWWKIWLLQKKIQKIQGHDFGYEYLEQSRGKHCICSNLYLFLSSLDVERQKIRISKTMHLRDSEH